MYIKEIEQKLFLGNNLNLGIFNKIRNLTSVDNFILKNEKQFEINDTYFDSKELTLARNNAYLRFRIKNDESQITLRIFEKSTDNEFIIDEITHPLNLTGIRLVMNRLRDKAFIESVDITIPDFNIILERAGLIESISIHNNRTEKEIWIEDLKIGRIKFDCFCYKPLDEVKFFEIETDIYKKIFMEGIKNFRTALKKFIECEIIETNVSKYKRGIENKLFSNTLFYQ